MGNKKNRNPEKRERKRIEKQQKHLTSPVQSNAKNTTKSIIQSADAFNRGFAYYNQGAYEEAITCHDGAIDCCYE